MTLNAFIGGAGCGKTFQLMASLESSLKDHPLDSHQKVLALTFMHGSRRRLDEKLSGITALRGKYDCGTIDSFASHIVKRWASLAKDLGIAYVEQTDYEDVCDTASLLLQHDFVAKWVAQKYPNILLDEAQDLSKNRLALFEALKPYVDLFVASDEFQCLDERLNPNPACEWIRHAGTATELIAPRRTDDAELLNAATAIRNGNPPTSGKTFRVVEGFNHGLAGNWMSNEIGWYGRGKTIAIITPASGIYFDGAIEWARTKTTKRKNGPHNINVETTDRNLIKDFFSKFKIPSVVPIDDIPEIISIAGDSYIDHEIERWIAKKKRCLGIKSISKEELEKYIHGLFSKKKRTQRSSESGIKAMTVHGAKNREFDNVIVLWPASVQGSDEQKRRLLYNAITRAKQRCTVIVQSQKHLRLPPFA